MSFRLPGLERDAIMLNDPRPKIECALDGCGAQTPRDVRLADSLPAPADAGWYEVELPSFDPRVRNVVFACSKRHGDILAAGVKVVPGLSAFSEHPVLPE
jgi:hypothetical protein